MTPPAPPAPSAPSSRLIFRWPEKSASFLLPVFFLLAVAVHGVAFYLFQVVYPPTVSIAPPPAQVTLLTPSSPQNEALLAWVEAQNPATASYLQETTPSGLGEIGYSPSYLTVRTLPKPVESSPEPVLYPSGGQAQGQSQGLGAGTALPSASPLAQTSGRTVHSGLTFSPSLAARDGAPGQPVAASAKTGVDLLPSVFLTAVDDRGEVRFTFLQSGSGDPVLDAEAETLLVRHDFKRNENAPALAWGFATFTWGAEAFPSAANVPAAKPDKPAGSTADPPRTNRLE